MKNLRDTLLKIFDQDVTIEYISGDENIEYINNDGNKFSACINGLKKNTEPDCAILDDFVASRGNRHYLICVDDLDMSIRICKASSDSDYDEYCVVTYSDSCIEYFNRQKKHLSKKC